METVTDLILGAPNITADSDCSHEIKRCLFLGRKAMTNVDSVLKSRHTTLPTKVSICKAMVFPVVMYGCESWTTQKAEHWRTDASELWCWRRLFRVPWTARRSNQSILKEITPEIRWQKWCGRWNTHTLATWCRVHSLEKILMLGKTEGRRSRGNRGWDGWMASRTQWTRVWVNSRRKRRTGRPGELQSMGSQSAGPTWVTEKAPPQTHCRKA